MHRAGITHFVEVGPAPVLTRLGAACLEGTDAVLLAVDKELDRLERMGEQNPEQAWVRNWLDAVVDLPWGEYATESND